MRPPTPLVTKVGLLTCFFVIVLWVGSAAQALILNPPLLQSPPFWPCFESVFVASYACERRRDRGRLQRGLLQLQRVVSMTNCSVAQNEVTSFWFQPHDSTQPIETKGCSRYAFPGKPEKPGTHSYRSPQVLFSLFIVLIFLACGQVAVAQRCVLVPDNPVAVTCRWFLQLQRVLR